MKWTENDFEDSNWTYAQQKWSWTWTSDIDKPKQNSRLKFDFLPISGVKEKTKGEKHSIRMDLSCNETIINDVENEYNIYVEYSDEKSATSAGEQQPTQQTSSTGIAKLYSNACADPTFLKDRCLNNLLTSQKRYSTPTTAYFNTVQKSLTPQMRKIVAEWVIEVSLTFHLTVPFVRCLRKEVRDTTTLKKNKRS